MVVGMLPGKRMLMVVDIVFMEVVVRMVLGWWWKSCGNVGRNVGRNRDHNSSSNGSGNDGNGD